MAGFVIQVTGAVQFEDNFRMGVLLGRCWFQYDDCITSRINSNTLLRCRLVLVVVCCVVLCLEVRDHLVCMIMD